MLAEDSFQERFAFSCLMDLKSRLSEIPGYGIVGHQDFGSSAKKQAAECIHKFKNPASFDQLSRAQANVDEVQVLMHDAIKKQTDNMQNLNVLLSFLELKAVYLDQLDRI